MLTIKLPESAWECPSKFPDLSNEPIISVDLETNDPQLMTHGPGWPFGNGHVAGIAIGGKVNGYFYFPIGHERGINMPKAPVVKWLNKVLSSDQPKVMFNATYDLGWLRHLGVEVNGRIHDPILMAPLLNEHRKRYNLDSLCKDYLDTKKDEDLLYRACEAFGFKNPKANMWRLPPKYVGPYAEQDTRLNVDLYEKFIPLIEEEGQSSHYDLECRLIRVLLDMRAEGVPIDEEAGEMLASSLLVQETEYRKRLKTLGGGEAIDIWSQKKLEVLYKKLDKPYIKTEKGSPSFPAAWLESSAKNGCEVAKCVLGARKKNRARSTYTDGLIKEHAHGGRIHCQFNPLKSDNYGTVTGRFSSSTPNLQQIPIRDPEIGATIRRLFIPRSPDHRWLKADYSQQEPRLAVHFAALLGIEGSEQAVEYFHQDDASFHLMVAYLLWPDYDSLDSDTQKVLYNQAKTINLGKMYGMGVATMAENLGMSLEEAKEFIKKYQEALPWLKELDWECRGRAERRGFIYTLNKRKARFPTWQPADFDTSKDFAAEEDPEILRMYMRRAGITDTRIKRAFTYKALNKLCQSSAADMIKHAMDQVANAGFIPHLTVHDELDFSVERSTEMRDTKIINEIMENCVKLLVPLKCDMELGENWGDVKKVVLK